jgi:hypothetical protein
VSLLELDAGKTMTGGVDQFQIEQKLQQPLRLQQLPDYGQITMSLLLLCCATAVAAVAALVAAIR